MNTLANADYYGPCGVKEAINGGVSDPRNATILKMFSMIDIGERAGSGIPGVMAVWNKAFGAIPVYSQRTNPDRILALLRLSGDAEENDYSNVIENATSCPENCPEIEVSVNNCPENCPENEQKFPRDCPEIAQRTFMAIANNPNATIEELSNMLQISPRTVKYHIAILRDKFIKRIGSDTKGHWEIIAK